MKIFFFNIILFCAFFLLVACEDQIQPKPKAYLSLDYAPPVYKSSGMDMPFDFEYNTLARVERNNAAETKIVYPKMKATVYLNYKKVQGNLTDLLTDAYQLPSKHIIKAEDIPEKVFVNEEKKVYGTLFTVTGNAASQNQFFLTDSLQHFLIGSLYFYALPNYDSIYPAAKYVEKDIVHLMESLKWRSN